MNDKLESNFLNQYKTIKVIKENDNRKISIIQIKNKLYILKESKSFKNIDAQLLRNEAKALTKLRNYEYIPKIIYYKFDKNN